MAETTAPLVMRVFTRGLRIPTLIGKLRGGVRIWGGPYTSTQGVGAIVVVVVGLIYGDLVLPFGWVGNKVTVLATAVAVGYLLGFVRAGGRDPVSAGMALLGVMSGPAAGRSYGRVVRLPRPGRAHQCVRLLVGALPGPAPATTPAPAGLAAPAPRPPDVAQLPAAARPTAGSGAPGRSVRALSGLERQLAASTATPSRS